MYTDFEKYQEYSKELDELISERNKIMSMTDAESMNYTGGEDKNVTLYYLSADIEALQKLVDDYVEIDEDESYEMHLQQHNLCYSQGLSF